jgi:hypothetical protein
MHNSLKIIKTLFYSYSALYVPGTLAPIIRSLLTLHIRPPVTVCRWVGCFFQLWPVTTNRPGLCDEPITRPEESYRLRYVVLCDL